MKQEDRMCLGKRTMAGMRGGGLLIDNGRITEHLSKEGTFYTNLYMMMSWRRIEVRTVSCRIFQVNERGRHIL